MLRIYICNTLLEKENDEIVRKTTCRSNIRCRVPPLIICICPINKNLQQNQAGQNN